MSVYAAPDAVGAGPPPGMGGPPGPGDPNSMAMLAAALQQGGAGDGTPGGPPLGGPGGALPGGMPPGMGGDPTAGLPPELLAQLAGGGAGGGPDLGGGDPGQQGTDLLSGMGATDHIRAAIKHLMMAMTESKDDSESHGITKGMSVLHGILAGKQKANATVTAAGGTPAGG
jgi:hypothetical protein